MKIHNKVKHRCLRSLCAVAMSLILGLSCVSCAMAEDGVMPRNAEGKTSVVLPVQQDFGTLDPFASSSGTGRLACNICFYEPLATMQDGELEMILMKDYEKVDDKTVRVTLYEYIHDSQGNPVTAGDVVFCYEQCMSNGLHKKLSVIESVEKVDDATIDFHMVSANPVAGSLFAAWAEVSVVSQAAYEASPDSMAVMPIGTGAYKVTSFTPGVSLKLERTGDYWQTNADARSILSGDNVDLIEFQYISEASQITVGLQTGAITMTNAIGMMDLAYFENGGQYSDRFQVKELPGNMQRNLTFNFNQESYCHNINLRKAIAYGIDASGVLAVTANGHGRIIHALASPVYGDYNAAWDEQDYFAYLPDKAMEYLAIFEQETGVNASDIELVLLTENTYSTDAEMIANYLSTIGLNVTLHSYESSIVNTERVDPSAWDIYFRPLGASVYWVDSFNTWFNAVNFNGKYTFNFCTDEKLQELIALAASQNTHVQENVDTLKAYIDEICLGVGLYAPTTMLVVPQYVTNIVTDYRQYIIPGACTYVTE